MPSRRPFTQLDQLILKVKTITPKTQQYLEANLEELFYRFIVPEIRLIALAMNMPKGFADGVELRRVNRNTMKIINTWGSNEKPLAKWFNYGTRDHGPKKFQFLHWIDKTTRKHIYARWVRGVPQTKAMEKGIAIGMSKLKSFMTDNIPEKIGNQIGL